MSKENLMYLVNFCAYLDKKSAYPGETIGIKIHCPDCVATSTDLNMALSDNLLNNGEFNSLTGWVRNQSVDLAVNSGRITVSSQQNVSTPGIKQIEPVIVQPLDTIQLVYRGSINGSNLIACPFIRGYNTANPGDKTSIIWTTGSSLEHIQNHTDIEDIFLTAVESEITVTFQVPSTINRLEIYFLMQFQEINDSFTLDYCRLFRVTDVSTNLNNLIQNSNFEENLDPWSNNGSVNLALDSNGVVVSSPQPTSTPGLRYLPLISVQSGVTYRLRYRGYVEEADYIVAPLVTGFNNDNGTATGHLIWAYEQYATNLLNHSDISAAHLKTSWSEINLDFKIPIGTNQIRIYFLYANTDNSAPAFHLDYVDLFQLTNSPSNPSSTPPPPTFSPPEGGSVGNGSATVQVLNKNKQILTEYTGVTAIQQKYTKNGFAVGMDWATSFNYIIPTGMPSDWYFFRVINEHGDDFYLQFIVKSATYSADILVLSNINTFNAYNSWAGLDGEASFYKWSINTDDGAQYKRDGANNSNYITRDRPDPFNSADIKAYDPSMTTPRWTNNSICEMYLARWLQENNYEYHVITDKDMHESGRELLNYKTFIIHGHPEYWSAEQMIALNNYRDLGGNIMYIGGNGLYWKVTEQNSVMECRKGRDTHTHDGEQGGLWKQLASQLSPYDVTTHLVNCDYVFYTDPSSVDIFGAPYRILQPDHWIFSGVSAALVGISSLNAPTYKINEGKAGASGYEVDQDTTGIYNKIAEGTNPDGVGAHMLYDEKNGGKIFSTGSISYTGSLWTDENLSKVTKNVLNYFLLPEMFFDNLTDDEIKNLLIQLQ